MRRASAEAHSTPTDCWHPGGKRGEQGSIGRKRGRRHCCHKTNSSDVSRMKPRCLLSSVDRLPTINEMQESDAEDGHPDCSSHTMEEYLDSIKELSQPAAYPRHGPLRGHRRWMVRTRPGATPVAPSVLLHSWRTHTPWIPIELSDISVTLTDLSNWDSSLRLNQNLLDRSVAQSLFAGLV